MTAITLASLTERRAFLLAQAQASLSEGLVTIDIPVDAPIATNKESRKAFEIPNNDGKWRWPAGGVAMIIKLTDAQVLLTLHRDKGAPSFAGHDTLSSGLGSSVREMLYPLETAWREGAEELCIVTPKHIVCPIPATDHFGFGLELTDVTRCTANLFPELRDKPIVDIATNFLALPGEKKVVINYAGKTRFAQGLVVLDPGTNGIDVLKAVAVPVDCSLDDLTVYDGEVNGVGGPLDRQVNALELDEYLRPTGKILVSWVRGKRVPVETKVNPMTPVLKAVYDALSTAY